MYKIDIMLNDVLKIDVVDDVLKIFKIDKCKVVAFLNFYFHPRTNVTFDLGI